jgi:hypothetical protein
VEGVFLKSGKGVLKRGGVFKGKGVEGGVLSGKGSF